MSSDNQSPDSNIVELFDELTVRTDTPNTTITVFCYGSAPGNHTAKSQRNATAAYACVFPDEPENNAARATEDGDNATNQRAILLAAVAALEIANDMDPTIARDMEVFSNSGYLNGAMNTYIGKWVKNGWRKADRKPVENQDLFEQILEGRGDRQISWMHFRNDVNPDRLEWAREFHDQAEDDAKKAAREVVTP
jgi:ribonuclease HI